MKINLSQFKEVLGKVKPGLSSGKETTEQSDCFVFHKNRIFTYNDEISVSCPWESPIEGAVPSKELLALVNKLSAEEVEMNMENGELRIKSGRSKSGLVVQADIHMPIDEIVMPKKFSPLPKNFTAGLKSCVFSASNDFSFPILTVVHCLDSWMESTDNDRATRWELSKQWFKKPVLIPVVAAKALSGYSDVKAYHDDGSWVHFQIGDSLVFSCRTIDGDFPDIGGYFKTDGYELEFPSSTLDILSRAGIFVEADNSEKLVHVSVNEKGVMEIKAQSDHGWYNETIRLKAAPKTALAFSIHPDYLSQILSSTGKATIGEKLVLFETENFKHVIALE